MPSAGFLFIDIRAGGTYIYSAGSFFIVYIVPVDLRYLLRGYFELIIRKRKIFSNIEKVRKTVMISLR